MTYYIVSAFLNSLTSLLSCIFVFANNPKSKTNRAYVYYSFFIFLWAGFQFLWLSAENETISLMHARIACTFAFFIPISFLLFTCHLVQEYAKHRRLIIYLFCLNLPILLWGFSPLLVPQMLSLPSLPIWGQAGPLLTTLLIEYIILVAYSLFLLYKKYKVSTGPQQQQLKYVFWGNLIAFSSGSLNFPLCYEILIPPFLNILIPLYTIFITYAIFKYQLMDIQIVIKRGLVYSLIITIMTLFYFLSIFLIERIFQEMLGYRSLFISLGWASIFTLAFIPLRNTIQRFVEKYLFRNNLAGIFEENEMLRKEIVQSERLKSIAILASGMAHEIKNPLTVLKTFAEFLPKKMDDKVFLKKFQPMILNEINRIDGLVHELMDFAKPASPQAKTTVIHTLINQTLEFLSNDFLKHKINNSKNYGLENNTTLNLDSNQIKQALLNIFLNAIDAMPSGGFITVTTKPSVDQQHVLIKIQDTGSGINSEDMPHIFDPFFTKKDHGTGLGLSITHEIIKNHKGKIFVESEKGKGTAFIIELPL